MFVLMQTPDLFSDIKIVQKMYILSELIDMIGYAYDQSDTQDGRKVFEKWDLYFMVYILSSGERFRVLLFPFHYTVVLYSMNII